MLLNSGLCQQRLLLLLYTQEQQEEGRGVGEGVGALQKIST